MAGAIPPAEELPQDPAAPGAGARKEVQRQGCGHHRQQADNAATHLRALKFSPTVQDPHSCEPSVVLVPCVQAPHWPCAAKLTVQENTWPECMV